MIIYKDVVGMRLRVVCDIKKKISGRKVESNESMCRQQTDAGTLFEQLNSLFGSTRRGLTSHLEKCILADVS